MLNPHGIEQVCTIINASRDNFRYISTGILKGSDQPVKKVKESINHQ